MGTLIGPGIKFKCEDLGTCSLANLGTADHGDLSGLGDDDHNLYLPTTGVRSMAGTLSMGSHQIDEVSKVMFTKDVAFKGTADYTLYLQDKADTMWSNLHVGWLDAHAGIYSYGTVKMQGHPLTGVVAPTLGSHAANKNYVDDHIWGADDITTGTFGADRIPNLPTDRYGSAVLRDGSRTLTADWDIGNGRMITADKIRARDGDGLALYEDGGAGIFVKDGGNVGIGETAPLAKLHIKDNLQTHSSGVFTGPGEETIQNLAAIGANQGAFLTFRSNYKDSEETPAPCYVAAIKGAHETYTNTGKGNLQFYTAADGAHSQLSEKMRINYLGDVGIGTTNPGAKLDVNGDGRFAGTVDMRNHPVDDVSKIGFRDIHDVALITEGTYSLSVVNKAESVWGIIETGYSKVHAGFAWYIEDVVAGEILYVGGLVNLRTADSKWWRTDADFEAGAKGLLGIPMANIVVGNTGKVCIFGRVTSTGWSWTVGATLYVACPVGTITETAPSGSGDQVRKIGHALTSNTIIFNPDATILEIT